MGLLDKIRSALNRHEHGHEIELYCPTQGHVVATERTTPVAEDREAEGFTTVATYDCTCGSRHRFGWGSPTPVLFDKVDQFDDENEDGDDQLEVTNG